MKRLIFDLDGTLTIEQDEGEYSDRVPNWAVLAKLREYKALGFEIIIASSRNMRTYAGSIGKINAITLPGIIAWLQKYEVPYDEIHIGKPWCGFDGFYIDDKAVRPSEFYSMTYEQIRELLKRERGCEP